MKHRRRKRKSIGKVLGKILFSAVLTFFLYIFVIGTNIEISYNKDKAKKARATFWSKTLKVATYIGDFKRAIFQ